MSLMKPGHRTAQRCASSMDVSRCSFVLKSSLNPGSLEPGRFMPAPPTPAGTRGGFLPPVCCLNKGPALSAASPTSIPAIHSAPEPLGHCSLRVFAGSSTMEAVSPRFCRAHSLTCLCSDATLSAIPAQTFPVQSLTLFFLCFIFLYQQFTALLITRMYAPLGPHGLSLEHAWHTVVDLK